MKEKWNARILTEAGVMLALSFVLGRIKIFTMPQGGSVTAGQMIPLLIFALRHGLIKGLIVGALYGCIDAIFGGYVIGPVQFALDYPLAYMMLGLAGIFSEKFYREKSIVALVSGTFIAVAGRIVCHVLSGVIFFAEYAGDQNPWLYSISYNGSFLAAELVIAVVIIFALSSVITDRFTKKTIA